MQTQIRQSQTRWWQRGGDEPYSPDPNSVKDDSDPLDLALLKVMELNAIQRVARLEITGVVCQQFREVMRVRDGDQWPKAGSPMPGMAVDFKARVNQSVNRALLTRVAEVSMQELKCEADALRPARKCKNLLSVAKTYTEIYGADPTDLLTLDLMSDEASGPEDDGEDALAAWKQNMATSSGMPGKSDADLTKMSFFEVVQPNWRLVELSNVFHKLWDLFWASRTMKSARNMIPSYAPYNFGINVEWYERFKVTHRQWMQDWFEHPDPAGFGSNRQQVTPG
ncbi:hypothetical protein V8D89_011051 [Ganoderma adspersum]